MATQQFFGALLAVVAVLVAYAAFSTEGRAHDAWLALTGTTPPGGTGPNNSSPTNTQPRVPADDRNVDPSGGAGPAGPAFAFRPVPQSSSAIKYVAAIGKTGVILQQELAKTPA